MTTKYFKYLFGTAGDRASVPNPTQLDGTVSYQSGFPVGYQLDYSDPASLNIPRDQFNQILYDVTLAVQQVQQNGFPEFITTAMNGGTAYGYSINACVYQPADGNNYTSLINSNTDVPPSVNWRLITFASGIPAGAAMDYDGVSLPAGWVWRNGNTVGNASSNATGRANADTADLFAVLWALPSTTVQLYSSAGAPITRGGSAASDFAANRAIATLDTRERVTIGLGTMGGTSDPLRITTGGSGISGTVLGAAGGVETVSLTSNQNGVHTHSAATASAGSHNHLNGNGDNGSIPFVYGSTSTDCPGFADSGTSSGGAAQVQGYTNFAGVHTHTVTVDNAGLGDAHQNVQPTIICNKIIKL